MPLDSKVGDLAVQIPSGLVPGLAARYHRLHWQSQGAPPDLDNSKKQVDITTGLIGKMCENKMIIQDFKETLR